MVLVCYRNNRYPGCTTRTSVPSQPNLQKKVSNPPPAPPNPNQPKPTPPKPTPPNTTQPKPTPPKPNTTTTAAPTKKLKNKTYSILVSLSTSKLSYENGYGTNRSTSNIQNYPFGDGTSGSGAE